MFILHIESTSPSGWDLSDQAGADALPLLHSLSREGHIRFTRPVRAHIHAHLMGEHVVIEGIVNTAVALVCSRCLESFERTVETDFSATAVPDRPAATEPASGEEIELTGDEIDVIPYQGESVDLRDEIAQQIIMALPFKPLCTESCKGLCSRCGANLNNAPCNCSSDRGNSPFAVLQTLNLPQKKE